MFVNVYRDLTSPIGIALSESKRFVEIETSVLSVELREQTISNFGFWTADFSSEREPSKSHAARVIAAAP